jgi:hypothetical protein
MTYKITHKNSTVSNTPPIAGDINVGEIAINAADAELYTKDTNGNIRKFQNTATGTADGVHFTQSGTGAVQRTVESKLQDVVSVLDFGADPTGANNSTAAVQAAVLAGISLKKAIYFPSGTYLITDTINLPEFTQIYGEYKHTAARGYGVDPVGSTKISFEPTTAKPLFVCSGTPSAGPYRRAYRIENLFIYGN